MATLTVSTNGLGRRPYSAPADESTTPECHTAERIEYTRYCAGQHDRNLAVLSLDVDQALSIAYDLLYQAVDAGRIEGFSVQHPADA